MRLRQLDHLRGLAVLLVLGRHLDPLPAHLGSFTAFFTVWQRMGWIGVDLFFVLSGFLVAGLLFSEYRATGHIHIRRFLARRGLKIYPAFYFLLAVTAALLLLRRRAVPVYPLICEVLYIQNYASAIWQHTWSLAAEEHFYLLLACAAAVFTRLPATFKRRQIFVGTCVAGMTAVLAARVVTWQLGIRHHRHYLATHLRFDAFLAGVLLSYIFHFHHMVLSRVLCRRRRLFVAVGLLLVVPFSLLDFAHPVVLTGGLTALYIGFALILVSALFGTRQSSTDSDLTQRRMGQATALPVTLLRALSVALAFIGTYSYSIYLWHIPVRRWLSPLLERVVPRTAGTMGELLIYLTVSLAAGYAASRLIELPLLRVRDAYLPSRASRQSPTLNQRAHLPEEAAESGLGR